MTIELSFSVQGYVNQTIELVDNQLTPEQIIEGLNNGDIVTTIQEGGSVEFVADGKVIGTVANVDNDCEYSDFDL